MADIKSSPDTFCTTTFVSMISLIFAESNLKNDFLALGFTCGFLSVLSSPLLFVLL